MANFAPLKNRFLYLLKEHIELFSIRGRFLDYGSGKGDVSEYLARTGRFTDSIAFDPAYSDGQLLERNSRTDTGVTFTNNVDDLKVKADLAVFFDVVEHLPDAPGALRDLHGRVSENGWLMATVPYNRQEWGVDDEFYGHLRRLSKDGVIALFEDNGWNVVRVLDPTFPTFWLIRKVYLWTSRFTDRYVNEDLRGTGTDMDKTLRSSARDSWAKDSSLLDFISNSTSLWEVIRRLDIYFESIFLGFELFLICQRRERGIECEVCRRGKFTHAAFFDRYGIQRCTTCGSERLLPECTEDLYNQGYYTRKGKRFPGLFEELVYYFRTRLVSFIRRQSPPENSLLDIGCGRGLVISRLKDEGWRVLGTQLSETAAAVARERGADVIVSDLAGIPGDKPFGVISLFHVIEHIEDLGGTLRHIDRLLLPGGILILEYPSANSFLKKFTAQRWFAYDPPNHRLQINPVKLSDNLGVMNYRLLEEHHHSTEYSFFVFAQTLANVLMPFQRDSFYKMLLKGKSLGFVEIIAAILTIPVFVFSLPLFLFYQPVVSMLARGCVVRQVFRKTDIVIPSNE